MVKNRFIHLFGRIAILCVMIAATILSVGIEVPKLNWYVYYTNLSNYFCMIVVFAEIIGTIVKLNKNDIRGNDDIDGGIKFAALIDILVTFLITNILLKNIISIEYWTDAGNVLSHFVCPILFWLDWILFAKHNNTRWFYPLEVVVLPIIYVGYILVRGFILEQFVTAADWQVVYPYFFLDVAELGYNGVGLWVFALCGAFVAFSYLICIIDNIPNYKRFAQERKLRKIARKKAKENYKKEIAEKKAAKKQAKKDEKLARKQALEDEKQAKIKAYTAEIEAQMQEKDAKKQVFDDEVTINSDKEFNEVLARAEKLMRKSEEGLSASQSKRIEKELKMLMDAMNKYKEKR